MINTEFGWSQMIMKLDQCAQIPELNIKDVDPSGRFATIKSKENQEVFDKTTQI